MPKDPLALGRVIVDELELPATGATLERWMAHELADLLLRADRAEGALDRSALEERAMGLIVDLWNRREALPGTDRFSAAILGNPEQKREHLWKLLDRWRDARSE